MDRKSRAIQVLLLAVLQAGPAVAVQEMEDAELAQVSGQALFVSDKIGPNSLAGAGGAGSSTDFTYYRVGLDVDMAFNLNIDKLQLGCGGSNENLVANACDIDMDYVRFMGRNGNAPGAAVTSDFVVRRPYIELAIKEDGNKTNREVVGIKIGFESADGALSIGREYANGQVNVEHGGTCTDANDGPGALACHSGINYMSGFLNVELSGKLLAKITGGSASVCFGDTRGMGGSAAGGALHANCDGNPNNNTGADASFRDPFFAKRSGTRMNKIQIVSDANHHPDDFPAWIYATSGLGALASNDVHVDLRETLRFFHSIILDSAQTKDFFLSFQREQIAYPKFDKSGYAATANTGWWMNIPYAAAKNLDATNDYGALDSLALLSALQDGANIEDLNLKRSPVSNCYGSHMFC